MALLMLALAGAALPARAQSGDDERYTIMRPEPGTTQPAQKRAHKKPSREAPREEFQQGEKLQPTARGSSNPVYPAPLPAPQHPLPVPQYKVVTPVRPAVPPPLFVPETGRTLPNLPPAIGSGPGGRETFQDRAARCAHQAGVYGTAAGSPSAYINSCINQ